MCVCVFDSLRKPPSRTYMHAPAHTFRFLTTEERKKEKKTRRIFHRSLFVNTMIEKFFFTGVFQFVDAILVGFVCSLLFSVVVVTLLPMENKFLLFIEKL